MNKDTSYDYDLLLAIRDFANIARLYWCLKAKHMFPPLISMVNQLEEEIGIKQTLLQNLLPSRNSRDADQDSRWYRYNIVYVIEEFLKEEN